MNKVKSATFNPRLTKSEPRVLRVKLRITDDESLRAASLGMEMLLPGARIEIDPITRDLLIMHSDSQMLVQLGAAGITSKLYLGSHLRSLNHKGSGKVVLELATELTPDYFERLKAYILEMDEVVAVSQGPRGPRFVLLNVTSSDLQTLTGRLGTHLTFGFRGTLN